MKFFTKPTLQILLTTIIFALTNNLFAQSNFEGKIDYAINYTDLPAEMKAYEGMLPKVMSILLKGNKSKIEQSQMMGTNVIVSDMDNKNGFIEMNLNGQKLRLLVSTEDFEKEKNGAATDIEYLDESKNILGYDCKKAIMKDEKGNTVMTVFYTEKINNKAQKEFLGLKGFPLQYGMTQQNMTLEITATGINDQAVPDSAFEKTDGFKDISQADLQKMMMGGGN